MINKYNLVFVMYGGGYVNFACANMQVAKMHIKNFIEYMNKPKEEGKIHIIFADDDSGEHIAMVVCSHVLGYYLSEDKSQEYLSNQKRIVDSMEKHLGDGEDWKDNKNQD